MLSNYEENSLEEKEHRAKQNEIQTRYDKLMDDLAAREAESNRTNQWKTESTKRYVKPIFELKPKEFNCNSMIGEGGTFHQAIHRLLQPKQVEY